MDVYLPIEGTDTAIHVRLRQGDLTRQTTDAIVNFRPSWFREHASGKHLIFTPDHIPINRYIPIAAPHQISFN